MRSSVGTFINDGKGFAFDKAATKTNMMNVLYNLDGFTCEIGQNGMTTGTQRFDDSEVAMFIEGNNCALYLKDDDKGTVWCISGFPYISDVEDFHCEHHIGYSELSSVKDGIKATLRVFVPSNYKGEVFTLSLENQSEVTRHISVVPAAKLLLMGFDAPRFFNVQNDVSYGDFSKRANGYLFNSINPNQKKNNCYSAVLCTNDIVHSFEGERAEFFGSNENMSYPMELLVSDSLSSKYANGHTPMAAIMIKKELKPGERISLDYALALVENEDAAECVYQSIENCEKTERLFEETVNEIDERYSSLTINTPIDKFNYFVNMWLKKGMEYCLQKKNATRDNLQFAHGLTMAEPQLVKKEIRKIMTYQYSDGHTVRSWQPMDTVYYSDGPLWIIMTACGYLKFTDDMDFLNEEIAYFDGGSGTVYEHLEKCIERINQDRGPHNLPLARFADWNDALNLPDENAESVFMAMAYGYMLLEMIELEEYLGNNEKAEKYKKLHAELKETVNKHAWDDEGEYYIRGFSNGERIGATDSEGSTIYVNPQSWSIIGGIVTEERLPKIISAVDNLIETDLGCMVNSPAYECYSPKFGRISAQTAGTSENGAVYCHATSFKVYADTICGYGDRAVKDLLKIMPDSDTNPASHSGGLPYALTSVYNTSEHSYGRAGRPFLTGSQGWVMNTIVEGILGVRKAYGGFKIAPAFPADWNEAECSIKRNGATYTVKIRRGEKSVIKLNGSEIDGNFIPFAKNGKQEIEVVI